MTRCPITFQTCEGRYSHEGLGMLSPKLIGLLDFPHFRRCDFY
jgi:hypothetical protein